MAYFALPIKDGSVRFKFIDARIHPQVNSQCDLLVDVTCIRGDCYRVTKRVSLTVELTPGFEAKGWDNFDPPSDSDIDGEDLIVFPNTENRGVRSDPVQQPQPKRFQPDTGSSQTKTPAKKTKHESGEQSSMGSNQ